MDGVKDLRPLPKLALIRSKIGRRSRLGVIVFAWWPAFNEIKPRATEVPTQKRALMHIRSVEAQDSSVAVER
ncbi:hypothetical protein TNCV_4019031 [Trichonephila clavipes]|nr:hypothetical protein TNCV_4019031 [Trichonephila clavipes]